MKMKVEIAAAQLSNSIAAAIETNFVHGVFPAESLHTAHFVGDMDHLFDSLNGNTIYPFEGTPYRCALTDESPHLQL